MLEVVGIFIFVIFLIGLLLWLTSLKYRSFPGLGLPIIGDLYYSLKHNTSSYAGFCDIFERHHNKYGEIVAIRYGPLVCVSVADPHAFEKLSSHRNMTTKEPQLYETRQDILEGAFSISKADKKWKFHKGVILRSVSKNKLEMYHKVFVERSWELVDMLEKETEEFDILPLINLMCVDIVTENFCGMNYQTLKNRNFELSQDIMSLTEAYPSFMVTWQFKKLDQKYLKNFKAVYKFLEKTSEDVLESLKSSNLESDFLNFFEMTAAEMEPSDITNDMMMKLLCELIAETQYTTGVCLNAAVIHLATNTDCQEKAWAEQEAIFGDSLRDPSFNDLTNMSYLERVLKESARISSTPIVAKRSSGDVKLGKMTIPKNATVIYFIQQLKKNTKYWANGINFDPDHFLPEEVARRPKYAYYAFSGGPRGCPGTQYAMNLSKVVLSILLRKFKISSPLKRDELTYYPGIFMHLISPHTVSLELRQ